MLLHSYCLYSLFFTSYFACTYVPDDLPDQKHQFQGRRKRYRRRPNQTTRPYGRQGIASSQVLCFRASTPSPYQVRSILSASWGTPIATLDTSELPAPIGKKQLHAFRYQMVHAGQSLIGSDHFNAVDLKVLAPVGELMNSLQQKAHFSALKLPSTWLSKHWLPSSADQLRCHVPSSAGVLRVLQSLECWHA